MNRGFSLPIIPILLLIIGILTYFFGWIVLAVSAGLFICIPVVTAIYDKITHNSNCTQCNTIKQVLSDKIGIEITAIKTKHEKVFDDHMYIRADIGEEKTLLFDIDCAGENYRIIHGKNFLDDRNRKQEIKTPENINGILNNSSNCYEFVMTPPFNEEEIRTAGFPQESDYAMQNINEYIFKVCIALPNFRKLSAFINNAVRTGSYALVKETPENGGDHDKRYFLSFGANNREGYWIYPVSIQLGLDRPFWDSLKEKIGFIPGKAFIDFVESFPGLVFGGLEFSEFINPPEYFANVACLLPQDYRGNIVVSKEKLRMFENYLFFQLDYWGSYRFIDEDDIVHELRDCFSPLTSTGMRFEDWVFEKMEKWDEPEPKQNT